MTDRAAAEAVVEVVGMLPEHAEQVLAIYQLGIDEGQAGSGGYSGPH